MAYCESGHREGTLIRGPCSQDKERLLGGVLHIIDITDGAMHYKTILFLNGGKKSKT